MNIWAIVPIKPFNRSKSRLASVLSNQQREALSRKMLERTLTTLKEVKGIAGILVISRDNAALRLARKFDVQTVQESGTPELNDALTRATQAVAAWNASGILIVASDIPLVTSKDIEAMLKQANEPRVVVIASDRRDDGTNALLVSPAGLIPYRFGEHSFQKHVAETLEAGAALRVYESPDLALDVDIPADLELYKTIVMERKRNELGWLGSL